MALEGKGPTIVVVMWLESIVALVVISLRLYTRMFIIRSVGWDDYLIIAGWFLLVSYTLACTIAATHGFGQHSANLTVPAFIEASKAEIIGQTFCIIGIAVTKASVAVFLLRLVVKGWHKWVLYATIFCVSAVSFICALFDFIRCDPIAHVWDPLLPANCWVSTEQFTSISITLGVVSTIADFVLAVLPWLVLWNLNMPRKEKILITSSMSLGIFAMVCGIIRTIALKGLTARSDYSWQTVDLILWSSTELMMTILTATIPTFRPLYKAIRGVSSSFGSGQGVRTRGFRLNNLHQERSAIPIPQKRPVPRFDTLGSLAEDHDHHDDHSERGILNGVPEVPEEHMELDERSRYGMRVDKAHNS